MTKLRSVLVLLIASVVLVDLISNLKPAQAQISPNLRLASDPPQPPQRGTPDGREPAGTRGGSCEKTAIDLKPLLPVTDDDYSGFTLTERPTFWFYVPYKTDSVSSGKFVLEDREGNPVVRLRFNLPKTPGFISVSIPSSEKPLEKNKLYSWRFTLYCTSQSSAEPKFDFKQGLVQRVDINGLETQLKTAKLEERIKLYADNKLWYDALAELPQLRDRPQAWRQLLRDIGLEQLNREAIAGEVVPIEN